MDRLLDFEFGQVVVFLFVGVVWLVKTLAGSPAKKQNKPIDEESDMGEVFGDILKDFRELAEEEPSASRSEEVAASEEVTPTPESAPVPRKRKPRAVLFEKPFSRKAASGKQPVFGQFGEGAFEQSAPRPMQSAFTGGGQSAEAQRPQKSVQPEVEKPQHPERDSRSKVADEEFDLRRAIIYSEILKPKFQDEE